MNTLRLKHVVLCGLLVASILAPAHGAFQGRQQPPQADVLRVVPAESVFCLRINNFDYTLSQMDQFIAGLSPIPMAVSMLARMQFAGILGDPQLAGVNMNGTFGAFALPMPGAAGPDPNQNVFPGILVPVTSYSEFLGNPNVSQPDAQGISQITVQGVPMIVAKQAGGFALVTGMPYAEMLPTVADSISSGRLTALGGVPGIADDDAAAAPIWVYVDALKAAAMAPAAGAMPGGPGAMPMGPAMMNFDIASMAKDVPVKSMTFGLEPKPNVFTIMARASAIPGTELAQMLVRGSAPMQEIYDSIGAKAPSQAGAQLSAVSALLPKANLADVVGTYDLLGLSEMVGLLGIPIDLPKPAAPSKSAIAYAITADNGRLAADIALPKEHVAEIAAYLKQVDIGAMLGAGIGDGTGDSMTMEVDTTQADVPDVTDEEPDDEVAKITASPFADVSPTTVAKVQPREVAMPVVRTDTSLFGDGGLGGVTNTAAKAQVADRKVRVAGVRLIRYSDLKLGVLPLGRGDGYTLSLIADLPGPAVKVAGGQIDKALTNNGKSLLPEDEWDRKVRFGRLSKDYKTAVFDVELLLPDQGALGLEELAGTLEYLTATGTKDVDLGDLALKAGAAGAQLGARISSIEIDPYENNAPVVALTLNVPAETVESVELYDKSDKRLEITPYGYVVHGNAATVRFFVEGELPAEARIVVHIFEGLERHNLPFSIRAISLAGLPMQ